jgi:uncharacterized membrane protein YkoI
VLRALEQGLSWRFREETIVKISVLALTLGAIWAASAVAGDSSSEAGRSELMRTVAYLESRYSGEVVSIALDDSGDKSAHYHVNMRFPNAGTAKLDVDATTWEISGHDRARLTSGWATLSEAATVAASQLPGDVIAAEFDTTKGAHYDVDVRLPHGYIARLKIDPQTRQLGWRTPAVIAD